MNNNLPNICDVIRDYTGSEVPSYGGNFQCFIHNDTSKNSMKYYPETNQVHCFGACSKTYNPITIVAEYKGIDNKEAYRELIIKYGLKPTTAEEEEEIYKRGLLEEFAKGAREHIKDEHKNALCHRGLTEEIIAKIGIGYISEELLEETHLTEEQLKDAGIIYSIGKEGFASNFADKIIIPMYDSLGQMVTIAAWNYKNIDNEPKYAYPKGLKKPVAGDASKGSFIVEGVFDLLIMQQMGFKTCSFLGLQPTKEQMRAISKVQDLKILLDGDEAGRKLANEIATELYPKGRIITLPESHDPNSYFLELGEEAFRNYINEEDINNGDFLEQTIEKMKELKDKREAARFFSKEVVPLIAKLDKTEQDVMIDELAKLKESLGIKKGTMREVIKKIAEEKTENTQKEDTNITTKLYEKIKEKVELYKDDVGIAYARFPVDNHLETHPVKGSVFKRYLQREARKEVGKIVPMDAINAVISMVEADGYFEGEDTKFENRVAASEDKFYYDLSDSEYRVVEITPKGWTILSHPKALFKREIHQVHQVEPDREGDIREILSLFPRLTPNQQILYLVFLVYSLIPKVPKVIMYVQGEKGSGKSDFTKTTRQLIDPSAVDSLKEPRVEDRVVQQFQHHYVSLFDNVNVMHDWFARLCCTAVTGESDEKRQLFTDDGAIIFSYMRVVIINAINRLGINFPDLQDRTQLFKIQRIPEDERMEREDFWDRFNKIKPQVLGGMFTTLSLAMGIKDTIKLDKKPRMADYAVWGCAIAKALGYTQDEFLAVYYENMEEANSEMIENHPIANAIYEFMKGKVEWKGKASDLLEGLDDLAIDLHIDTKQNIWPKSPSSLSMRLNEINSNLLDVGIKINRGKETGSNATRYIEIYKVHQDDEKKIVS